MGKPRKIAIVSSKVAAPKKVAKTIIDIINAVKRGDRKALERAANQICTPIIPFCVHQGVAIAREILSQMEAPPERVATKTLQGLELGVGEPEPGFKFGRPVNLLSVTFPVDSLEWNAYKLGRRLITGFAFGGPNTTSVPIPAKDVNLYRYREDEFFHFGHRAAVG